MQDGLNGRNRQKGRKEGRKRKHMEKKMLVTPTVGLETHHEV